MGMKFEYTLTPPREHWDADHFAYFYLKEAPPISEHAILMVNDGKQWVPVANEVHYLLPAWEEALRDQTIPVVALALETAILEAAKTGATTLVICLPTWVPVAILVLVLADLVRKQIWKTPDSKLMNIRLACPTQEIYDGLAQHFQGTWEL